VLVAAAPIATREWSRRVIRAIVAEPTKPDEWTALVGFDLLEKGLSLLVFSSTGL
jgi:hypothetical protein